MRFTKEHLTFKALVSLDEAAQSKEPVPKSFALRFALAYLYATSAGERWLFDDFWRNATAPKDPDYVTVVARRQSLSACMNGICRAVGMDRSAELIRLLREACERSGDRAA